MRTSSNSPNINQFRGHNEKIKFAKIIHYYDEQNCQLFFATHGNYSNIWTRGVFCCIFFKVEFELTIGFEENIIVYKNV